MLWLEEDLCINIGVSLIIICLTAQITERPGTRVVVDGGAVAREPNNIDSEPEPSEGQKSAAVANKVFIHGGASQF